MLRNGTTATAPSDNFKEEIVDVIVMVTQAVLMTNLSVGEINAMAQAKLDRVLKKTDGYPTQATILQKIAEKDPTFPAR